MPRFSNENQPSSSSHSRRSSFTPRRKSNLNSKSLTLSDSDAITARAGGEGGEEGSKRNHNNNHIPSTSILLERQVSTFSAAEQSNEEDGGGDGERSAGRVELVFQAPTSDPTEMDEFSHLTRESSLISGIDGGEQDDERFVREEEEEEEIHEVGMRKGGDSVSWL